MNDRLRMSRRTFLQTATAAAAALAVAGVSAQEKSRRLRLGLIGTGSRGNSLLGTLFQFQ
jgi:hypothetical protein